MKNSHVRIFGYGLLVINIIIFFLTWLRWYIGFPATLLLLVAYCLLIKNIIAADQSLIRISKKTLVFLCMLMFVWALICGLGGGAPQKPDLHWRNAILHDLINHSWPVHYSDGHSSLTYYFAFWLAPTLLGKLSTHFLGINAGWITANIAYSIYCICMLSMIMLLLVSYLKASSLPRMLLVAVVLIFFSGLDIIPIIRSQVGNEYIIIGNHLEWWTMIQYSSNTTQLAWVFNQAVPAWLVTALLLHEQRMYNFAFLGLLLLPYGPIPFVGIFLIMVLYAMQIFYEAFGKRQLMECFHQVASVPNILAILVILPIYYFFYFTNNAVSAGGFHINRISPLVYLVFVSIEFLFYVIAIMYNSKKEHFFVPAVIGLLFIPLFTLGNEQDFCMRASIPLLFIVMVYVIRYLLSNISLLNNDRVQINVMGIFILCMLLIGSATPLTEFRETYRQTVNLKGDHKLYYADKIGTLENGNIERDNFVTMNSENTVFYRYLARNNITK